MILWIIQITIISFILIFLVHHLINFFKTTLTVPKIKDLVNSPTQKYENMYNIINKHNINSSFENSQIKSNDYTLIDLLPNVGNNTSQDSGNNMKDELKKLFKGPNE